MKIFEPYKFFWEEAERALFLAKNIDISGFSLQEIGLIKNKLNLAQYNIKYRHSELEAIKSLFQVWLILSNKLIDFKVNALSRQIMENLIDRMQTPEEFTQTIHLNYKEIDGLFNN